MTALMQDVIERVQTLPERKLQALWIMLADDDAYDKYTIIVETDLTQNEKKIVADGCRNFRERPDDYVSIDDYMKKRGMPVNEENIDKLKIVYR